MEQEPDDEELIRRFRQGDREAFVPLLRRHKGPLIESLRRTAYSYERAEEFAAQTLFIFYEHPEKYEGRGQLAAYLYRVGMNVLFRNLRYEMRMMGLDTTVADRLHLPPNKTPEEIALQNEGERLLMHTAMNLPRKLKQVFVAHEMDGFTIDEIATMTGAKPGAVRTALSRAREAVRRVLGPWWHGVLNEQRRTRRKDQNDAGEPVAGGQGEAARRDAGPGDDRRRRPDVP
jgi:RNA polymerase sigma-70 factor (ECF subfamily)